MVYTVTLNTSIDHVIHVDKLDKGRIHKTSDYSIFPGGKGLNVSQVLKNLGIESIALGYIAGPTGNCLSQMISEIGIKTEFINLREGFTRINTKIRSDVNGTEICETDINEAGPVVHEDEIQQLIDRLKLLNSSDTVVFAGSVPASVSPEEYGRMIGCASNAGALTVVDATGEYLKAGLAGKPFLIKPNKEELADFFDADIDSEDLIWEYAGRLQRMGAANVLVSLGGEGAALLDEKGEHYQIKPASGQVVNTVGAGDSMVAGFLAGLLQDGDKGYALRLATAAGSATAFSEGLASEEEIKRLLDAL